MGVNVVAIAVTAVVSVGTTVLAIFYGPTWKDRVEAGRARQQRSDYLLAQYAEPLARAAFDLQSRLYNISRKRFTTGSEMTTDYRRLSSLWLLGQFLGWMEIVRREVQIIDYGDVRRTAMLQRNLFDVADLLSTNTVPDGALRVFRSEQRAIGELMVTDRPAGEVRRSDCIGYAEFIEHMEIDPAFARWFTRVSDDLDVLLQEGRSGIRLTLVQRALIDLIDFFDPQRVRFPDPNERGKIPLPPGYQDRKRLRPTSQVARFRFEADPSAVIEPWAKASGLTAASAENTMRVSLPSRMVHPHDLVVLCTAPWVEIHVVRRRWPVDANQTTSTTRSSLTRRDRRAVNDLLRRFDRPLLPV